MKHEPKIDVRPWGRFLQFTENEASTVKLLEITAGEELSLQRHEHREEFWFVLSGSGTYITEKTTQEIAPGNVVEVPLRALHSLKAGSDGLRVLEIAFGTFDETDITRVRDKYHRNAPTE